MVHANDITADCLGEMLSRFAARGYRFVTLDEAMGDPAYQTKDMYVGKYGPTWIWRWLEIKDVKINGRDDPEPPEWVMELSRQK